MVMPTVAVYKGKIRQNQASKATGHPVDSRQPWGKKELAASDHQARLGHPWRRGNDSRAWGNAGEQGFIAWGWEKKSQEPQAHTNDPMGRRHYIRLSKTGVLKGGSKKRPVRSYYECVIDKT